MGWARLAQIALPSVLARVVPCAVRTVVHTVSWVWADGAVHFAVDPELAYAPGPTMAFVQAWQAVVDPPGLYLPTAQGRQTLQDRYAPGLHVKSSSWP